MLCAWLFLTPGCWDCGDCEAVGNGRGTYCTHCCTLVPCHVCEQKLRDICSRGSICELVNTTHCHIIIIIMPQMMLSSQSWPKNKAMPQKTKASPDPLLFHNYGQTSGFCWQKINSTFVQQIYLFPTVTGMANFHIKHALNCRLSCINDMISSPTSKLNLSDTSQKLFNVR